MITKVLQQAIIESYFELFEQPMSINKTEAVGGGCINNTAVLHTDRGLFFVKWNNASLYPGMFDAEAKGLKLLLDTDTIEVPTPLLWGSTKDTPFLLLKYIESGHRQPDFWNTFGTSLAALHRHSSTLFGLDHDNYIGSLKQWNTHTSVWADFMAYMRLEKQTALAYNVGLLNKSHLSAFERLYQRLEEIFPSEAPALLHGDLWSGNFITGTQGSACIFDPAVYYGHREIDLAMTMLFGGFAPGFYEAYNEVFPLEKNWRQRVDICNLYPLLVHLNLFGKSYLSGIEQTIKIF